jgi:hypothetical protein
MPRASRSARSTIGHGGNTRGSGSRAGGTDGLSIAPAHYRRVDDQEPVTNRSTAPACLTKR